MRSTCFRQHAGTLDPMVTGVLVIGIERATKILGLLTARGVGGHLTALRRKRLSPDPDSSTGRGPGPGC